MKEKLKKRRGNKENEKILIGEELAKEELEDIEVAIAEAINRTKMTIK